MTGLMERKWEGEINGETEQKRQQRKKEQEQKGFWEGHFATFRMVHVYFDKSVLIEFTRTNTRHHLIMFQELYLKLYPYILI